MPLSSSDELVLQYRERPYLTVEFVAEFLGVSTRTIHAEVTKGALPAMRCGRVIRIHARDLSRYCGHSCDWNEPVKDALAIEPNVPTLPRRGIYFVQYGQHVKIGISSDVIARCCGIRQSLPTGDVQPLAFLPFHDRVAMQTAERELHQRFAASRTRGEWFVLTTDILDYIYEHGQRWPYSAEKEANLR